MERDVPTGGETTVRAWVRRAARALGLEQGNAKDPLGLAGERLAGKHLRSKGYRVLGRNLRVPMGEADLLAIAPDGETVVLVEVKSRRIGSAEAHGGGRAGGVVAPPPEASITAHKRAKLVEIMRHLARANGWQRRALRIDAVAVEWPETGEPVIRHHAGAVAIGGDGEISR